MSEKLDIEAIRARWADVGPVRDLRIVFSRRRLKVCRLVYAPDLVFVEIECLNQRSTSVGEWENLERDLVALHVRGIRDADAEAIAHAPSDIDALLAEVERLRECMRRAGLAAFMRGRDPNEIADHLQSVLASYEQAARRRDPQSHDEAANSLVDMLMGRGWHATQIVALVHDVAARRGGMK